MFLGSRSRGMTNIIYSFINTSEKTEFRIPMVIFSWQWYQQVAEIDTMEYFSRNFENAILEAIIQSNFAYPDPE